ncbi:hypothetical protein DITRI_Ditri06bG0069900 [Diplodiscus trichospermus]
MSLLAKSAKEINLHEGSKSRPIGKSSESIPAPGNVMWGSDGDIEIRPASPNLFIIQLQNVAARDCILEPGGLSYIASAICSPLYMDRVTAYHLILAYAKLCVEVDVVVEIPRFIDVQIKDGSYVSIAVEVPWHPQKCSQCSRFGHTNKVCPKKVSETKKWVPKKRVDTKKIKKDNVEFQPDNKIKKFDMKAASSHNEEILVSSKCKGQKMEQSFSSVAGGKFGSPKNASIAGKANSVNRFEILDSAKANKFLEEDSKIVGYFKVVEWFQGRQEQLQLE